MTGTISCVRELEVRYKPRRLPVAIATTDLRRPQDAARLAAAVLAEVTVEQVIALHVNTKYRLIGVHVVSVGTLNASLVHPRDVFKAAFLANAAGLILAHNHPSGDVTPSSDDIAIVARLRAAGSLLDVQLFDALIVSDISDAFRYFSFSEAGVLP